MSALTAFLLRAGLLAAAAAAVLPWLFPEALVSELISPFVLLYLPFFLLAAVVAALRRWRLPWLLLAAGGVGAHGYAVGRLYRAAERPALATPQPLRICFANVLAGRRVSEPLLAWIREQDPDVAAFAEVGPHYDQALSFLNERMPYSLEHFATDTFGLAVYSRYPLEQAEVRFLIPGIPTFTALLPTPSATLRLIVAHLPPPSRRPDEHASHLRALTALVRADPAVVLLGDLNISPWSPRFRLLAQAGLRDARQGFGPAPTWSPKPLPLPLLPLDHVLVKGAIAVNAFQVGPRNRSDHRPVFASLEIGSPF